MSARFRKGVGAAVLASATLWSTTAPAAEKRELKVGVAKLDITPSGDLGEFTGIVPRPYGGVHDHLFARALVLESGGETAAIVALDLVEMGNTLPLRERVARELGIPADHIIIAASHDHSAPRGGPVTANTSSAQGRPYSPPAYIKQVDDTIVGALKQARDARRPARMAYGTGQVDVSHQRYGYTPEHGWRENTGEEGFSDKTLAVVKFESTAGEPIAILFNYAVHSNAMTGLPGNVINGDIAGNAEKFVENQYGGKVTALWTMGAAADQYPKFNWDMGLLDPTASPYAPGEMQGSMIGGEVMKTIKRMGPATSEVTLSAAERSVSCPMNVAPMPAAPPPAGQAPAAAGQRPPGPPPAPARQLLPAARPGDTLPIRLGLIRLGEVAITGVSGEVGSQVYQHLKATSPLANTLMVTLSNDRDGYIPDDAGWDHQGPAGQAFVRGCAEKAIVDNLTDMIHATMR